MAGKKRFSQFIALLAILSVAFATSPAQAASLYWDSNGVTAGAGGTPTGTWGTSNFWNTDATGGGAGAFQIPTTNVDDLFFVAGPSATSGNSAYIVTVNGAQVANSLTFQASGATTISGGTSITLGNGTPDAGGINVPQFAYGAVAQGAATISTAVILNNAQTWTNNAASTLTVGGGLNLNGSALTVAGTGTTSFDTVAGAITGAGGIVMNGTGSLVLSATQAPAHSFTGGITISGGGRVGFQAAANVTANGNVTISNGYLGGRFSSSPTFVGGLGSGATQIRITGGTSGFSGEGSTSSTFTIGTALSTLQWGSTNFNPTALLLGGDLGMNTNARGFLNNGIDLNAATRTITSLHSNGNGALTTGFTISGVISTSSGTAGIIKTGVGNIIFNAANTYNGGTTISGGTLTVNSGSNLGTNVNTNNITLAAGTRLNLSAAGNTGANQTITLTSTAGSLSVLALGYNGIPNAAIAQADSNGGVIAINAVVGYNQNLSTLLSGNNYFLGGIGTTSTFTGAAANVATGAGSLYRLGGGGGTISFNTANLFTSTNAVQIGSTATNGTGTVAFGASQNYTGNTAIASGSALQITGASQLNSGTYAGDFSMAGGALTYNSSSAQTFSGNLTGAAGTLTKAGAGTLTLSGTNSYSGVTTLSGGTLAVVGPALGSGAITWATNNTTLQFQNDSNLTVTNTWSTWGVQNQVITKTLVVDRMTPGSAVDLTFNQQPNTTNGVVLNLQKGSNITSGTPTITFSAGFTSSDSNNGTLTGTGGSAPNTFNPTGVNVVINGIGSSARTRGYIFQGDTDGNQVTGTFANGSGTAVRKAGTGTWTFNGISQYTGVTEVTGGTLKFGRTTALYNNTPASWTAANISVQSGATLAFNVGGTGEFTTGNVTTLLTNLAASSSATNGMSAGSNFGFDTTNAAGGTFTISDVIANTTGASGGARGLTKLGTGTLVLSNAANTYTGATNVNGGTLAITGAGTINSTSAINVAGGARFAYNSSVALSGAPTLTLNGAGIGSRAVLGGTGTINQALTLDNLGDVLSPGNSPGLLAFGTNQTWASNSYDWELNDWAASVPGTNIDQINITGSLDLTAVTPNQYVLNVLSLTSGNVTGPVNLFTDTNNSWTLLTTTTGITGFDASEWSINTSNFATQNPTATGTWSVSQSSNNLLLSYVVVPEPGTLALLGAGVAIVAFRFRKRFQTKA